MKLHKALTLFLSIAFTSLEQFSNAQDQVQHNSSNSAIAKCSADFSDYNNDQKNRKYCSAWLNFKSSDPRIHDSKDFRYIVHGVNNYNFNALFSHSPDSYLNSKKVVSTSLISNTRKSTYGKFGLIIEIDPLAIIQVFNEDTASWNFDQQKLEQLKAQPLQFTPTELLEATMPTRYNEVLLDPTLGQKIKVIGLFVNVFKKDEWLVDDELKMVIQNFAKKYNLPTIEINQYEE